MDEANDASVKKERDKEIKVANHLSKEGGKRKQTYRNCRKRQRLYEFI